jgi:hypothetical protein
MGFPEGNQVAHFPEPIRYGRCHCWRHAQYTVNLDEIVREVIEGHMKEATINLLYVCGVSK